MTQETDREMLELAAKAAGYEPSVSTPDGIYLYGIQDIWNPLTDDGDALRLAVKLEIMVDYIDRGYMVGSVVAVVSQVHNGSFYEPREQEPYAATRRAIVRAAAEIGKAMA